MANNEVITCDYDGCDKPFAYRFKGFNLCASHCLNPNRFVPIAMCALCGDDAHLKASDNTPVCENCAPKYKPNQERPWSAEK